MPEVAVVLSGTETHRQPYGEVEAFFHDCVERSGGNPLTRGLEPLTVRAYADENTDELFQRVRREKTRSGGVRDQLHAVGCRPIGRDSPS